MQDDMTGVKDLEAIKSISLNSTSTTSNITNTCPANPKFITNSSATACRHICTGAPGREKERERERDLK